MASAPYAFGLGLSLAVMVFSASAHAAPPPPRPAGFAICGVCHKTAATDASGIGPNLWGVGGKKAGTRPGFAYSSAMQGSKIVWDKASLVKFITDPKGTVPGTKMAFAGQKDPKVAGAIADYVLSLK
jgi:cytochrome c